YKQVMREIDDLEEQKSQIYTEFEDKKAQIDNLDQRELEISRREQAAANKETKNKNLDKEIRRKEFILNDLDQKEQNTRDNWSQWVRTTEKLTKKRRLGTPDDYLVVGTFGTVDKEASKRKIANLIDLAEHGKLIKEVEAENRQLRNQGIDQFRGFVRQEKRLGDEQRQRELEELRKKNKEQEEKIKDQQRQILQLRMFAEATVKTIRGIAKAIPEKAHALWQKIGSNLRKVGGKTYVKMNADEVKEANKGYSAETEKQKSIYNQRYNSRDLDL
ncbi:hypothetical protein LAE11_08915, partial [Lactobacillus johnsonii]|nr:hypothetical protein [Lactobacillus johnsonii]